VPVVGPRFLIEAGFIIAVAVIAGIERFGTAWIVAMIAAARLIVAVVRENGPSLPTAGRRPNSPASRHVRR
jgi:hypothetical protein